MPNKSNGKINRPIQLIVLIFGGVICILLSIIGRENSWPVYVYDLLNSIGGALIIGPALSWILDLRSMIDYFKRITVESLVSKEYLANLDRDQLLDLRKECTAKIHLKETDNVEKGLINLDESVCELLTQPYLERYRQNTTCEEDAAGFFNKTHYMEEFVKNPLNTKAEFKEFPKVYIQIDDEEPKAENYMNLKRFTVKIDDQPEMDITNDVKITLEKIVDAEYDFDSVLSWVRKNGEELKIEYHRELLVNRIFTLKTPNTDITFMKRLTLPVKSLKIDYSYSGPTPYKLIGSCFGTLSYSPNDNSMKVIQNEKNISIESFNWLLPGNGIFIVKTKK